jgi:predicted dehydrogenase
MSASLKVGVIGVGGIAASHMPGWAASRDAQVVAGADLNSEVLAAWGKTNGVKTLYEKPLDLIADPDIDIVDICTPSAYHAPLTIAALDAGKHVLCEKPLAINPAEIRDMIAARDRSKKMLMTAQHIRFSGTAVALKNEIDTGILGDVYHARAWLLRRYTAPGTRPGFVIKKHSGGGPCIDIGVHILDLTLWMMGNPKPVAVTGTARTELAKQPGAFCHAGDILPEYDVEDFAACFVRFENGTTLILETSWMLHHNTPGDDMQMWLYGTKAGSHWPSCSFYSSNNQTKQLYDRQLKCTPQPLEAHAQECASFARAIVEGAPSPVPAEQSLDVMSILDAVYDSERTGREVRLDQ